MAKATELTRRQLEQDYVEAGVAKWGEEERDGLLRQAASKSLETLRVEYDIRHGDEAEALADSMARQRKAGVSDQYQAGGALEDGLS